MYNYFVLVGPVNDPAKCAEAGSVKEAFARIAEGKFPFVSRGDASGTHTKEVSLWPEALGITTDAASVAAYSEWYLSSNAGMGVCLTMANEMDGYILSDKGDVPRVCGERRRDGLSPYGQRLCARALSLLFAGRCAAHQHHHCYAGDDAVQFLYGAPVGGAVWRVSRRARGFADGVR